jgi:hypothetical protein
MESQPLASRTRLRGSSATVELFDASASFRSPPPGSDLFICKLEVYW